MKVKDLIQMLSMFNQEDEVVLSNLEANPREKRHHFTTFRVYRIGKDVVVDAYEKVYK
jgi:hypothetical protein